tara:strand:- start:176 stop:3049 length:2874 start_codon:yes stop_codon:yes gene_type:complete
MGFFKNFVKALSDPVNIVVAAVSTAVLGPIGGYTALQSFAIRAGVSAALSSAAQSLSPKPKLGDFASFSTDATGRTQMVKQPITARRAVYGQTRVSGPLAFIESTEDDKYLHLVVLLAAHESQEITTVYLNDEALTLDGNGNVTAPSRYANLVRVKKHLGADDQAADAALVSEVTGWTNQHRLRGITYVYVRLESDPDAFPNGIPNVSALVKGKKLYDPRTGSTAYSTNPALVIRDYLTNSSYGFAAASGEIDDTAFTTAANICDESISLAAGGTESRYTCNGTIDSANAPRQTLEALLSPCGGIMTYTNGKFGIKAAKYVSPTLTLTNDDLRGPIGVQTKRSRRDNFNAVKGVFAPPSTNYVPTDYPVITSSTFQTEDGGIQQFLDLDLPYTQSSPMAQRLAKIALFRNRQQVTMDYPANLKAFQLSVGDTVQVTNDRFGFSSKVFEVAEWSLVFEGSDNGTIMGVDLMLRELASTVYDWDAEEADFLQDNSTLPDPFTLNAPSLTATDVLRAFNETAISVLQATVTSTSIYAKQFEVQAKKTTDTEYTSLGIGSGNVFELVDVEDNAIYDVRARIINGLGVRSPFVTVQHQIIGKTAPPQDVSGFSVNIIGTEAHLSWTPVTDLDLSHYHVRHARETTGATYSNSIDLAPKVSRPANTVIVPAMTGTYFIKAVDKLGNASTNAASKVAIIEDIKGLNAVATSTQHPAFSGTKSGTVVVDNVLKLKSAINFDDLTGNFDDAPGLFDGAGGNTGTSGTYDFDNYVDLGQVFTSRVTATVKVRRAEYVSLFDSREGLFDAATGTFDGDVQAFDDTNVELLVAVTEDDPAGTPTYTDFAPFFVGDYKARAFKFRANLTSTDEQASPEVTELSVTVDMPDRTIAVADTASGAGAKAITFSPAFKDLQGIGITAQNLNSGDYYAITAKSATGFTITFYNSSDTAVDRTFDFVAKGYGEVAA